MTERDEPTEHKPAGDARPATRPGVAPPPSINPRLRPAAPPPAPDPEALARAIRAGDRGALSRAITLVESRRAADREAAHALVEACLPAAGGAMRVGITGVPGVGKSTFIERLGMHLVRAGHRVAVLAVDPTSDRTGGSILGDKTRMPELAASDSAFVRPSPSSGALGGVAGATRETMLLCEAAGYDVVLVETVGVGQSESLVHSMVDHFLLLALAGAGDELQGIKRGIVEMADSICITKADGANAEAARRARGQFRTALHLYPAPDSGRPVDVRVCSALTGEGVPELWDAIEAWHRAVSESGHLAARRARQARFWFRQRVETGLRERFEQDEEARTLRAELERQVASGAVSPFRAADLLVERYWSAVAPERAPGSSSRSS